MSDAPFSFDTGAGRKRATLSLAPLIDATFILLIFFMLVSQFGRHAPIDLDVTRTSADANPPPAAMADKGKPLKAILQLHADGAFMVNGRHYPSETGLAGAIDLINAYFRDEAQTAPEKAPRLVLLKPDPPVTLQQLIDALTALKARPEFSVSIIAPPAPTPAKTEVPDAAN